MSTQITAAPDSDPRPSKASGGFFSLYKSGQGYWTRLGTALGAAAIILFVAWFVFSEIAVFEPFAARPGRRYAVAIGVAALLSLLTWWLMNAPKRAQFLIDTDSELKKVNWASRPELVGSTRIVIFFMLMTALMLFIFDTQFHALFHTLKIWAIPFEGRAGLGTGVLLAIVLLASGFGLLRGGAEVTGRSRTAALACLGLGVAVLVAWIAFVVMHPTMFNPPAETTPAAAAAAAK